jgi:hypothetical protein
MTRTEHIAKSAFTPKTGIFALLRGLLGAKGSRAGGRVLNLKATDQVHRGPSTAAKISLGKAGPDFLTADKSGEAGRPGENLRVLRGCVANYKQPRSPFSTSVKNTLIPAPTSLITTPPARPHHQPHPPARLLALAPIAALLATLAFTATPAMAEPTPGTGWQSFTNVYPTNLQPGGIGTIQIQIMNTGAKPSAGPITVTDVLPPGLTATAIGGLPAESHAGNKPESIEEEEKEEVQEGVGVAQKDHERGGARWSCHGTSVITCMSNPTYLSSVPHLAGEDFQPVERLAIAVDVQAGESGTFSNSVTVAGGGAPSAAVSSDPVTIGSAESGFGFSNWDAWFSNANGTVDTQAGSHPYQTTFAVAFNELANGELAGGEARDLATELPPGFFGEPGTVPQCTRAQLDAQECPPQSDIGTNIVFRGPHAGGPVHYEVFPLFNMVPPPGVADEFAMLYVGLPVLFDSTVSSAGGYRIVTHVNNIPQIGLEESIVTLWGVPPEASHNAARISYGHTREGEICRDEGCPSQALAKPFLTLPTSCTSASEEVPSFAIRGLSTWQDEDESAVASVLSHNGTDAPTGFTGCGGLSIDPSLSAVPDTSFADTPTGLSVEVKVPQEGLRDPEGVVAATLKNTTVTLPPGIVINPGQAAGLTACSQAQANIDGEGPQTCPNSSKVGTVEIETPLLEGELEPELKGNVYVLQSNPPEVRLLITASGDGIFLKLPATVHLCESAGETVAGKTCAAPGQLITTVDETPELPFTNFKLTFSGGAQAALDTPTQCGAYAPVSDFTPWTSPFGADVFPTSPAFAIDYGPGESACPSNPMPFTPELIAGATTDQAGGFTNFSLLLKRGDGQQRINGLQFKAPEGLTGFLSNVPLCTNAQAESNTCPAASKIGHTVVESGPGPYPLVVPEPGQEPAPIYLTEKYDGAPFGLSIVVPLHVGPFVLPTQRVRARIEVNPTTSALTVTTNPLPQEVAGVPTDIREIDSVIEKPEFMVNPTNCNPSEFSGTAYGTPPPGQPGTGTQAPISSHFQVGACRALEFAPKFSVSTSAQDNFNNLGADLVAKVSYPNVPQGTEADISRFKVELPLALPSRLTTLQKACLNKVFEENPAKCPPESFIGHAVVHTQLLPVPLEGPAVFVSHGGEAFPSLTLVLQGDGVTVDIVGTTFISHAGITSTTFKTVPDDPFNTFELTLPKGKFSALASNTNVCKPVKTEVVKKKVSVKRHGKTVKVTKKVEEQVAAPLEMPTEIIGQNGAEIHEQTKITVEGCPKAKAATKKHKKAKKGGKGHKK